MVPDGKGRVRLDYEIPSRGLIGFQTDFMSMTSGTGLKYHIFDRYRPANPGGIAPRRNGALISNGTGKALGYALFSLQERGRMMVSPGDEVYEGQVGGIHSRDNDLIVNPRQAKHLTNIRAAGADENILLTPPVKFTLEQALEFIEDDELVEDHAHGDPGAQAPPHRERSQAGESRLSRTKPRPERRAGLTFGLSLDATSGDGGTRFRF